MQIGVVFPQTEIGPDAGAVRSYGQRVEELGFRHVLAYDHVVGAAHHHLSTDGRDHPTSLAETASSATRISGSSASARAIPMRCRCPPENSCG